MRKFLALLLLAGASTPALAAGAADERHGWQSHRDSGTESRSEDRGDRSDRSDRPHVTRTERNDNGSNDRPQPVMRVRPQVDNHVELRGGGSTDTPQRVVNVEAHGRGNGGDARVRIGSHSRFDGGEQATIQPTGRDERRGTDTVRDWRGPKIVRPTDVAVSPTLRQPNHPVPAVFRSRVPVVSDTPREGTQPALRNHHRRGGDSTRWSTNWRNDHRYDWNNWRRHHRSIFHLGIYYDPFGWGYRPYQIGWRLWPSYYSSSFWLNDPWQYRLPYAPPGTRWIRYYDDALLVDTFTGEVVDVIRDFFW